MTDDTDLCGEPKGNGEPCENPVKFADGKCGIHSEINGDTQGRPTKFTNERAQTAIEAAREEGKSIRGCERAAGVGEGVVRDWLEAGHQFVTEDGLIDSFPRAFAQARAQGESEWIEEGRSPEGDASFAKFMLASSYDYKETAKTELEHSGEIDGFDFTINASADN